MRNAGRSPASWRSRSPPSSEAAVSGGLVEVGCGTPDVRRRPGVAGSALLRCRRRGRVGGGSTWNAECSTPPGLIPPPDAGVALPGLVDPAPMSATRRSVLLPGEWRKSTMVAHLGFGPCRSPSRRRAGLGASADRCSRGPPRRLVEWPGICFGAGNPIHLSRTWCCYRDSSGRARRDGTVARRPLLTVPRVWRPSFAKGSRRPAASATSCSTWDKPRGAVRSPQTSARPDALMGGRPPAVAAACVRSRRGSNLGTMGDGRWAMGDGRWAMGERSSPGPPGPPVAALVRAFGGEFSAPQAMHRTCSMRSTWNTLELGCAGRFRRTWVLHPRTQQASTLL
jgi:hypothetical protein